MFTTPSLWTCLGKINKVGLSIHDGDLTIPQDAAANDAGMFVPSCSFDLNIQHVFHIQHILSQKLHVLIRLCNIKG